MSQELKTQSGNKKSRFYVLVYNAQAGRVKGGVLQSILTFFDSRKLEYKVVDFSYIDWNDIHKKVSEYEDVRFIAAGGDGTLRLLFEGLWKEKLLSSCTVAFVALGSANVTALSFRLPFGLTHALKKAVEGTPRSVDLGLINDTYIFFIAASFGAVSNVVVGARRELKKKFGGLAYVFSADTLLKSNYSAESFDICFEEEGKEKVLKSHSMVVCNHFSIAGLEPARGIRADDEHLHLITLHNTNPWGLMKATYDFFRRKRDSDMLKHVRLKNACYTLKNFKGVVTLDGDAYPNLGDTLTFCVLPRVAKLVT